MQIFSGEKKHIQHKPQDNLTINFREYDFSDKKQIYKKHKERSKTESTEINYRTGYS